MDKLFEIRSLRCSYDKPYVSEQSKIVLEIEHLTLPKGKRIFIVGESGIGKSTILEVIGMMNNTIVPCEDTQFFFYDDNGEVDLIGMWLRGSDAEISSFRRDNFNFIFQSTNLMRNFTALENIAITRVLQGYSLEESIDRAQSTLAELGISDIGRNRFAQELSGGQQQRLAFARAIIPDFTVLFGDEPTGNLDHENAMKAMQLLSAKLASIEGSSAIIVTHDMHLAVCFADVIVKVRKKDEHGFIDDSSAFTKSNAGGDLWSNGTETYSSDDFENYLRKRI